MNESVFISGWRYRAVLLSVAFAALGYLAFSLWGGWKNVVDAVARVGVIGVSIALGLAFTNYVLRFLRWQLYLKAFGHRIPVPDHFRIYLAGFALTTTPGKAGEALRGVLLKPWGVTYAQSFAAFISERFSDLAAIVVMTLFGLSLYPQARPMIAIGVGLVVAAMLVLGNGALIAWIEMRIPERGGRVAGLIRRVLHVLTEARSCHRAGLLAEASVLSLIAWSAEAFAFHLILSWMGSDIPLTFAVFVYAISMLAGALSFMPGGLGGAEAVMVSLLVWHGMGSGEAVAATVLIRLATLWFAVGCGVLFLSKSLKYVKIKRDQ